MASCGPSVLKPNSVEPGEFVLQHVKLLQCSILVLLESKAVTMELCQVSSGVNTMKALSQHDKLRIQSTSQKISKKYCKGKISVHKSSQNEMNMLISLKHLVWVLNQTNMLQKKRKEIQSTHRQICLTTVVEQTVITFAEPEFEFTASKWVCTEWLSFAPAPSTREQALHLLKHYY